MKALSELGKRAAAAAAVCLMAATVSCVKDTELPTSGDNGAQDGTTLVRLDITLPERTEAGPGTRAVTDVEYRIDNICVLMLTPEITGTTSNYLYRRMVEAGRVAQDETSPDKATFQARIPAPNEYVSLLVLANVDVEAVRAQLPAAGTTAAELYAALTADFTGGTLAAMPMAGVATTNTFTAGMAKTVNVAMKRSLAKANVKVALAADSHPFRLASVALVANDKLQLYSSSFAVPTSAALATWSDYTVASETESGAIYLPECDASLTAYADASCIVVGGYFADDTEPTYHRIDFTSRSGSNNWNVRRNYSYTFTVTKALTRGYDTPEEAAANPPSSLVANMLVSWDDSITHMYTDNDGHYLGVSTDELMLDYRYSRPGRDNVVIQSNQGLILDIGGKQYSVSQYASFSAGGYVIILDRKNPKYTLNITALSNNTTDAIKELTPLKIIAGDMTHEITMRQANFASQFSDYTVNVLSIGTSWGSLGGFASFGQPTGMAHKIKDVLTNKRYFGPTGTVKIAGFNLKYIPTTATDADSDVENLRLLLRDIDIVRLAYGTSVTNAACANAIVDWTLESPNHLLFVTADSEVSNVYIRNALNARLGYRLGWHTAGEAAGSITFTADELAQLGGTAPNNFTWGAAFPTAVEGDEEIMGSAAAFGAVDRTKAFAMSDGTFGWVAGPYPYRSVNTASTAFATDTDIPVIPLIVVAPTLNPPGAPYTSTTNPAHIATQYMVVGVNPTVGIAYIGEAQICNRYMLDKNGYVDEYGENNTDAAAIYNGSISPTANELNRIYCNLWAWAVYRVLDRN